MKQITLAMGIVATLLLSACAATDSQSDDGESRISATVWQQRAGEYDASTYQAYQFAKMRLSEILARDKSRKPKAIVVDIDETVLSNTAFQAYEIKQKKSFSKADWKEWVNLARARPVAGALGFLNYAKQRKVSVFYLTNRYKDERGPTLENLQKYGFPFADNKHLIMRENADYSKDSRRRAILENYNVVLLIGDNLGDFSDDFYNTSGRSSKQIVRQWQDLFGKTFIIIPNPITGKWEDDAADSVGYKNRNLSTKEKLINSLQGFKTSP